MEHTYFDYGQEFSRIQHMFAKIINTEILAKIGLFYWGGDTTGYDGYPTMLLGHSLLYLVCFFDYKSHVTLFIFIIVIKFVAVIILPILLYFVLIKPICKDVCVRSNLVVCMDSDNISFRRQDFCHSIVYLSRDE
jgi:hypothetical protein